MKGEKERKTKGVQAKERGQRDRAKRVNRQRTIHRIIKARGAEGREAG